MHHAIFGRTLTAQARALNPGLALGTLRVAPQDAGYARDQLVALPETPADLKPAAGIVTRGEGNRLDVAEFAQWGEPLDDNVTRVLAENLSLLLPTQRAEVFPWKRAANIDYQVTVEMSRFDGTLGGDAVLAARWQVRDDRTGKEIVARKSTFSFPAAM